MNTRIQTVATLGLFLFLALPCSVRATDPEPAVDKRLADALAVITLNPKWSVMLCRGDSMKPYLQENDLIIVERGSYSMLEVGMIAVYLDAAGDAVVHRIAGRTERGFEVIGIGNEGPDIPLLTSENFQGNVIAILKANAHPGAISGADLDALQIAYCKSR